MKFPKELLMPVNLLSAMVWSLGFDGKVFSCEWLRLKDDKWLRLTSVESTTGVVFSLVHLIFLVSPPLAPSLCFLTNLGWTYLSNSWQQDTGMYHNNPHVAVSGLDTDW